MEETLNIMLEQIKNALGNDLKSFILYGSKASGEDAGKRSDYNTMIVLEELNFEHQKLLVPITAKWIKAGNPPPLLFSMKMLNNSADVFPIEFLDIKEHHRVLYGEDPFEKMKIDMSNLRHQCEFELKGKLLSLQQAYLLAGGKADKIKEILVGSISSMLVLIRHSVRLTGQEPPAKKLEALDMLSKRAGFSPDVFAVILKMKSGEKSTGKADMEQLVGGYLTQIEKIVRFVDELN